MIGNDWKSSWRENCPCHAELGRCLGWICRACHPCRCAKRDRWRANLAPSRRAKGKSDSKPLSSICRARFWGCGTHVSYVIHRPHIWSTLHPTTIYSWGLSWVCLRWFCNISALENPPEMGNLLGTWFIFLGPLLICHVFFGLFGEFVGQIQVLSSITSQTELRWCLRPWNCWSPFCGKNDGQTLGATFCFRKDWEREIWGDLKQKGVKIASSNHFGPLGSPGERIYLQKLFAMTHANVFGDFLDELKLNSYPHLAMQNNKQKL